MTNAQLNTLINTIETGGLNTALEVRDVLQGIKGEMFPTIHNIFKEDILNLNYNLKFIKIGNIVFLMGYIANYYDNVISTDEILIDNSLYFGKTGEISFFRVIENGSNVLLRVVNDKLYLSGVFGINNTLTINNFYKTND